MPIIRIAIPQGVPDHRKEALRTGVKRVAEEILDPGEQGTRPEIERWVYVSVQEAWGALGDGLPTVTIDGRAGRREELKRRLAQRICETFDQAMGTRDVYVLFRETAAGNHLPGGCPLPEVPGA